MHRPAAPDVDSGNEERRTYFLSDQAYVCEIEGGAIILDLSTGGYLGIDARNVAGLRECIANWPKLDAYAGTKACNAPEESEGLIAALLARGTVTISAVPRRSCPPAAAREALTPEPGQGTGLSLIKHALNFAGSLLYTSLRHRNHRLVPCLAWLAGRQDLIHRDGCRPSPENLKRLLSAFFRLRVWFYTTDRQCLFDSLVLAMFLSRSGVPCTLMIGVSPKPFMAHAWVQSGDRVLNDTAEHIQMFAPILAVGE